MLFAHGETTARFFRRVVARPRTAVALGLLATVLAAAGLARLVKDTSVDAFIPQDHPSVIANDRAETIFGVSRPMALAVLPKDGGSVFRPDILELVRDLTEEVAALPNIRPERVASLATESSISGRDGSLFIDPYVPPPPSAISPAQAADAARRWRAMPPHIDTLVSGDAAAAAILAEVVDEDLAVESYRALLGLAQEYEARGAEILVAGPAAVSGYLSAYIDSDARKLQPLVFLVVLAFIYLAFRRGSALFGPLLVIAGATGGALGLMAWSGTPYFAITNALPVIVVAISVADAIHILSAWFVIKAGDDKGDVREQVVQAMTEMARPVTLTTLTTMAGFAGIGFASIMPPITFFAWFAMLGVALAWLFSIIVLPNVLVLLNPALSPAFAGWSAKRPSLAGRVFAGIGSAAARRPGAVLCVFATAVAVAVFGALQLRIDRAQVENFAPGEPIREADERINERFAGTAFLDVIVEADEAEGLLSAAAMEKILALQQRFESLPRVQKTVSIADYIGLLHGAIEGDGGSRGLPATDDAIAQYLFLYEVTGNPEDLDEEIDRDYRTALVRGILDARYFSETRPAVEALQGYLQAEFGGALSATLAGDVNINYHWMDRLQASHFRSLGLSLLMVLAIAWLSFGALHAGLIAIVPVSFTVLALYGVMGYAGILLEPATSMFAAISVGVGVDFAIHLVDRLRRALDARGGRLVEAIAVAMPATARACFFNVTALGAGFAVLLTSDLPTLERFGALVTVAAFGSFLTSLVVVPALFALRQRMRRPTPDAAARLARRSAVLLVAALAPCALPFPQALAEEPRGREIAERVAARPEGRAARRVVHMTLTPARGRPRERTAVVLKRVDEAGRRTRITYTAPKRARNISFLSHDDPAAAANDNRWLYTPATRRIRRIPAADRGDAFQGTDFSYADVQSELKFDLDDYLFRYEGRADSKSNVRHRIVGRPRTAAIARELGYGRFSAVVDEASWMPVQIEFFDPDGEPLKTVSVETFRRIEGIWTATHIEARNHRTGHRTRFRYTEVSYPESLAEDLFLPMSLQRGLPADAAP